MKLRNLKYRNKAAGQIIGDAPLEYPHFEQQLDIKHKMRKVYQNMKLNRYLDDADSDLNSYSSAEGKDLQAYTKKYKSLTRLTGQQKDKKEIEQEKREKLNKVLGYPSRSQSHTEVGGLSSHRLSERVSPKYSPR